LPELPEVETVRRDLEKTFAGQAIGRVTITGARTVRRNRDPEEIIARMEERTLTSFGRLGKYLIARTESSDAMVVHLGMSGQLRVGGPQLELASHTHMVIDFSGGSQLRFVDPRTFGEVFVTTAGPRGEIPELAHLGFDVLTELPSSQKFAKLLSGRRTRLKALLLNQGFLAGIGNIYSDEILYRSRLRYDRLASDLSATEVRRLRTATSWIIRDAVDHRGSTLADLQYRDMEGDMGDFQRFHKVYGREGQSCIRCRATIVRQQAAGRSTFFCPNCQI
jgi:formamidopyrimidine-DNA glycosylase